MKVRNGLKVLSFCMSSSTIVLSQTMLWSASPSVCFIEKSNLTKGFHLTLLNQTVMRCTVLYCTVLCCTGGIFTS